MPLFYYDAAMLFFYDISMPLVQVLHKDQSNYKSDKHSYNGMYNHGQYDQQQLSRSARDDNLDMLRHQLSSMSVDPLRSGWSRPMEAVMMSSSRADQIEGILQWALQDPAMHAERVFEIYDNLFSIRINGKKTGNLPPSLRLRSIDEVQADMRRREDYDRNEHELCYKTAREALDGWEEALMNGDDFKTHVERYLDFFDFFWLPKVNKDPVLRDAMLKLLRTKDAESVLPLEHAMDVFPSTSASFQSAPSKKQRGLSPRAGDTEHHD